MSDVSFAEALVASLREALETDERVHLMGGYFLGLTPKRTLMNDLRERFPDRIWYPPISEIGYVGTAIGAAIAGLRPIVDIATASFIFQAWAQIANEAANIRYMTGGGTGVPVIFHFNHGIRGGGAAQHSHSPQAMLWNTPGLKIMAPSTPGDVRGLMRTALQTADPVMFVDHVKLFDVTGPACDESIPFGRADVKRPGRDVTLLATSYMVHVCLEAAASLAERGIDAEVLDPRTLVPLDTAAIVRSVAKTRRVVIVDECHLRCGVGAELAAVIADEAFGSLRAPVKRVAALDVPIPFSRPLEAVVEPSVARVVTAVEAVLA